MGPVWADRLTGFLPRSVPSAIYQIEVSSKQEFHTLLTMWLLSAAAPAPINGSSSFLPFPPCHPPGLFYNCSRGFVLKKKSQDLDLMVRSTGSGWQFGTQGDIIFYRKKKESFAFHWKHNRAGRKHISQNITHNYTIPTNTSVTNKVVACVQVIERNKKINK